jgi:iron(III) transport system permease protein
MAARAQTGSGILCLRWMIAAALSLTGACAHAADAALTDAAKKEGEVVWYTTQIITQLVRPVSAAFEKKYGIKVRATRANSTELAVKIINESRAGKPQSDVFDGTSTVVPLKKEGYVLQWLPEPAKAYPAHVYSMPGMIAVEGFLWSPLAFLLVGATLRNANPELEEAARVSGAGLWATIQRVTLRLSLPSMLALAMLVFIRAIEAFEVPALVGLPGRVPVLTTDIYSNMVAKAPPDIGGASALSVLMLVLVMALLAIYGRLSRHAERFATITGKGFRPRPFDLGRARYVATAALMVNFVLLLVVPMAMLAWVSLLPFYQPVSGAALKLLTLNNYRTVFSPEHVELIANTLLVAVATATFAVALTFVAAWLAVRRAPGGWALERLATIPLVFPGLILGIAVMQLFLNLPIPLYGTLGILVWAFVINYLPYGMRYGSSGVLQIHRELEESAEMCGASPLMRLRRIVAPLLAPALLAGWLFIFLMAARVLSLAILLAGPRSQTMAVTLFDLWTNGQGTELAALGLLWSMLMAMIAAVFYVLARRFAAGALA